MLTLKLEHMEAVPETAELSAFFSVIPNEFFSVCSLNQPTKRDAWIGDPLLKLFISEQLFETPSASLESLSTLRAKYEANQVMVVFLLFGTDLQSKYLQDASGHTYHSLGTIFESLFSRSPNGESVTRRYRAWMDEWLEPQLIVSRVHGGSGLEGAVTEFLWAHREHQPLEQPTQGGAHSEGSLEGPALREALAMPIRRAQEKRQAQDLEHKALQSKRCPICKAERKCNTAKGTRGAKAIAGTSLSLRSSARAHGMALSVSSAVP